MIFCFVVGTDLGSVFKVGSNEEMCVSDLREVIYEKNKNAFKNFDANKLKLWKADIPSDKENDNLKALQSRSCDMDKEDITIQKLGGELLAPSDDIDDVFKNKSKNIRIIIQPPLFSTDQGLTDIPCDITNLGYLPRQDGLGGTSLSKFDVAADSFEGISLTDPDTNQRSDFVSFLAKRLEEKRVILVQAPPYSGKTSLAQLLENHLVANSSKQLRIIRISLLWGIHVGKNCEYDTFGEVWEKIFGVGWYEWAGQCEKVRTVLIMDEVQKIYKNTNKTYVGTGTAADFWETIKMCFQGYNLSVIMFAAYGHGTNSASLSTPVIIPGANSMSLADIRFTYEEIEAYVKAYCYSNFGSSSDSYISQFTEYIKKATDGHAGLVRHVLHHTKNAMQDKIRNGEITWKGIFKYLNSQGFSWTIDLCRASPNLEVLSEKQKEICQDVYLKEEVIFSNNDNIKFLVESGILIPNDANFLRFSAPLIERSFFQQYYGREERLNSTPDSLYEFIVNTFKMICNNCNESSKSLNDLLKYRNDSTFLERMWQIEFYRMGTRALGNRHFLSCEVGAHIEFYINGLDWAIEFLRGHHGRKEVAKVAKETAIIDILNGSNEVQKFKEELKEGFVHVSYSNKYDAFMIECLGKEITKINVSNEK